MSNWRAEIAKNRRPRIDGVVRRERIVRYLQAHPGARFVEVARGVDLVVRAGCCPVLSSHLNQLEQQGRAYYLDGQWFACEVAAHG